MTSRNVLFGIALLSLLVLPVGATTLDTASILKNSVSDTEVYIGKDGAVVLSSAEVMQLAGRSFYTRLYWGDSFVRLLVKTNPSTSVVRQTGEATTYSEIAVGDHLNMQGRLESNADALVLIPTYIKDVSVEKGHTSFSGSVAAVTAATESFALSTKADGIITIKTSGTTVFTKGSRNIGLTQLAVGDIITGVNGEYDYATKTLTASSVAVFLDENLYRYQNFQGTLVGTPGSSASSVQIRIDGVQFTVTLPSDIILWNKARGSASLARFVSGDVIRLHGKRREADTPLIDADILRDMNF